MNSVNNINGGSAVSKIVSQPIKKSLPATTAESPKRASDRVEISGISHMLQALKTNDIRGDKVAAIKAQLEAGTYDEDAKLDQVTGKILDDLDK